MVEAKPCLAQAEELDPTDPRWPYLQGWGDLLNHPEEAAPCFERAVARCGANTGRAETARLRLAQTLLDRGDGGAAAVHFRALLDSPNAAPLAHLGLGSVALNTGDLDVAVMHLDIAKESPLSRKRAVRSWPRPIAAGATRRARTSGTGVSTRCARMRPGLIHSCARARSLS